MTEFDSAGRNPEHHLELSVHTDKVVGQIEALGLELDMDLSDVNPFDSMYIYAAKKENDSARLRATKADLSDFHGAPVTTNQYGVKLAAKEVDADGLRLVEEFTITQDKVADELKLGKVAVELTDPITQIGVTITGDMQPQPDRFSHRVTLGEFDENGDFIIDDVSSEEIKGTEVSPGTWRLELPPRKQRTFNALPALDEPNAILRRLEEVLASFAAE